MTLGTVYRPTPENWTCGVKVGSMSLNVLSATSRSFHFRVDVTEPQPDVRVLNRGGDQFRLESPGLGIGIEHRAGGADELECLVILVVIIVRRYVETGLAAEQGGFEPGLVGPQDLFLVPVFILGQRGQQGAVEIACLHPAAHAAIEQQVIIGRVAELQLAGPEEIRGLVRMRGKKLERHAGDKMRLSARRRQTARRPGSYP